MNTSIEMKKNRGFTLIELLVVVSIIGMLASVVLASLSSARAKGRDSARVQTIHSVANALELYRSDHTGYPASSGESIETLSQTLNKYMPTLPAGSFGVSGGTDIYVSDGNAYELLFTTETAGYGNNSCLASDYGKITGSQACLGMNVSTSLWTSGGGSGSGNPNVAIAVNGTTLSSNRSYTVSQGSTFTVTWDGSTVKSSGLPCQIIDGTNMFYSYSAPQYQGPTGSVSVDWTKPGIKTGAINVTCSQGSGYPSYTSYTINVTITTGA